MLSHRGRSGDSTGGGRQSHPLFAESYAALLDATINNKKVWLRVKDGSPDCELAYVTIENP